jgi:uncharacterized protein (DUF1778 family)
MTIAKKPNAQALDAVIKGGQEVAAADADQWVQISLKLKKADLAVIDQAADARRIARAAFIRQAVFQVIEG